MEIPFWGWLVIGGILAIVELLTFTFVLVFFALGALFAAAVSWFGMDPLTQILTFALASLVLLFVFRKKFLKSRAPAPQPDVGSSFILSAKLPAHGEATVTYQGSPWTAASLEENDLAAGEGVTIAKTEGIKLFVKKRSP